MNKSIPFTVIGLIAFVCVMLVSCTFISPTTPNRGSNLSPTQTSLSDDYQFAGSISGAVSGVADTVQVTINALESYR